MKGRPKPKSNAVLKTLPRERQEQIAEWCAKPNERDADGKPIPQTGGLAFAQEQLAADGVKVSLSVVGEFWSWWRLEQDLEISFEREEQVLAKTGDRRKAREAGESLLMRLGIARQDPELISAAAKVSDSRRNLDLQEKSGETKAKQKDAQIAQKNADLALSDRRVKLLEKKAAEAEKTANDATLSDAEKAARIREIFKK